MGIQRRRAANMLVEPALQLKLPLVLLTITLVFAAFQIWHSYYAFNGIFDVIYREAGKPEYLDEQIVGQTRAFIELSAEVALVYVLVIVAFSVMYAHRMVGPTIAIRRHIEALKNGDYGSRVQFRKGDAFAALQDDLNELAQLLEREDKKRDSSTLPAG